MYFTAKPCIRGSFSQRKTGNKECLCDLCRIAKRESGTVTYLKNREKYIEGMKDWQSRNKEKVSEKAKQYRQRNSEKLSKWFREHAQRNKERIALRAKEYNKMFPEKKAEHGARYRARKCRSLAPWFSDLDEFIIKEAYRLARTRKKSTGVRWCVDHIIPIAANEACGLHCFQNIQVIPEAVNLTKKNKMIFTEFGEWIKFYED